MLLFDSHKNIAQNNQVSMSLLINLYYVWVKLHESLAVCLVDR